MSHAPAQEPPKSAPKVKKSKAMQLLSDLLVGGTIGAISKTIMAPVERVKLLMQTQDSNPKVLSGEVKRYSGIGDCFSRVKSEQGFLSFWRGNLVNCLRYAPQQGSALAFNDLLNNLFPNYSSKTEFWKSLSVKLFSGGLAGAIANTICYPFDFARTRLASDVSKGKGAFDFLKTKMSLKFKVNSTESPIALPPPSGNRVSEDSTRVGRSPSVVRSSTEQASLVASSRSKTSIPGRMTRVLMARSPRSARSLWLELWLCLSTILLTLSEDV